MSSAIRVSVYTPLNRLPIPSGVPRHIKEVVPRLMADHRLDVTLFANRNDAAKYLPGESQIWSQAPLVTFDQTTKSMHRRWGILGRPYFERMGGDADWVYLPADGFVPVRSAKLAITIHDVFQLEWRRRSLNDQLRGLSQWPVYWRAARNADVIFTVSSFSASRIIKLLGVPASRIEVIYNGISEAFFDPLEASWLTAKKKIGLPDGPFFLVSGGLKPKKNSRGILAAWEKVAVKCKDASFVVTGHNAPEAESAARSLPRVFVSPRLTDDELVATLGNASALFFPSLYEGFGMPALEAAAAGTPVIASSIPVFHELLEDSPVYVDPKEPNEIAQAMISIINGVNEASERIEIGKKLARQYTWEKVAERVSSVLAEGCGK
jgi:glycosyltransferase involved in cell wall biosynthesis